jgi:hypothetical protein
MGRVPVSKPRQRRRMITAFAVTVPAEVNSAHDFSPGLKLVRINLPPVSFNFARFQNII